MKLTDEEERRVGLVTLALADRLEKGTRLKFIHHHPWCACQFMRLYPDTKEATIDFDEGRQYTQENVYLRFRVYVHGTLFWVDSRCSYPVEEVPDASE